MKGFEYLINEDMVKAIYLTLFHSLWQGALIAVLAGIIMIATRKASSARRYNLLLISLIGFVSWSAYTFTDQTERLAVKGSVGISNVGLTTPVLAYQVTQNAALNIADKAKMFFNAHANTIVVFWFIVICLKSIQLLVGLSGTVNLRRRQISSAGFEWEERLNELSEQIGIKKYVQLFQSGIAKVPMTIGYLKPVILMPVGLLASIPQDQIEAILLHELAHIKRNDYLVNVIQSMVEILFFFNPAIWWLSSLLRTERENCCDDIAVAQTINKSSYINALVSFEEYRGTRYASAITGSKNHLLNRAKRLIYNHNKTLNPMEKIFLTCGLVITGFLTVAFTHAEKHAVQKHTTVAKVIAETGTKSFKAIKSYLLADTITEKQKKSTINASLDGKTYKMIMLGEKIAELYVDNQRVPDDKILEYAPQTSKIISMSNQSKKLAEDSKAHAEQSRLLAEQSRKLAEQSSVLAEETGRIVISDSLNAQSDQIKVQEHRIKLKTDNINKEIRRKSEEIREKAAEIRRSPLGTTQPTVREERNYDREYRPIAPGSPRYNPSSRIARPRPTPLAAPRPVLRNAYADKVVQELIHEGIIKDKYVAFKITNSELIVNGVKQSPEIHGKILSKIAKNPSDAVNLEYSSSTNGRMINIDNAVDDARKKPAF